MDTILLAMIVIVIAWLLPTPAKVNDRMINAVILVTKIWTCIAVPVFVASIVLNLIALVL